jgi:glycosyl transferase family 25
MLDGLSIPFERVAAVDGRALDSDAIPRGDGEYPMARSEVACVLSHMRCWDLFEASGETHCAIIEDDVHLGARFKDFITEGPWLSKDFDVVKIEGARKRVWLDRRESPTLKGHAMRRLASKHMGSAGYVVSRAGLGKLRQLTARISHPIDEVLFGRHLAELNVYQLVPAIVAQDQVISPQALESTIAHERGYRPKLGWGGRIGREIARPFRDVIAPGPFLGKLRLRCEVVDFA